jgi:biotin carboxyl carrier protein
MPQEELRVTGRIRRLAEFLATSDAVRVRVEREGETIEVGRRPRTVGAGAFAAALGPLGETASLRLDTITADLVGIFRLSRPAPTEGERLEEDRELAYIEALGIRNPVHSLGAGRIVAIASDDGEPVEYGQPLFLLDRG